MKKTNTCDNVVTTNSAVPDEKDIQTCDTLSQEKAISNDLLLSSDSPVATQKARSAGELVGRIKEGLDRDSLGQFKTALNFHQLNQQYQLKHAGKPYFKDLDELGKTFRECCKNQGVNYRTAYRMIEALPRLGYLFAKRLYDASVPLSHINSIAKLPEDEYEALSEVLLDENLLPENTREVIKSVIAERDKLRETTSADINALEEQNRAQSKHIQNLQKEKEKNNKTIIENAPVWRVEKLRDDFKVLVRKYQLHSSTPDPNAQAILETLLDEIIQFTEDPDAEWK